MGNTIKGNLEGDINHELVAVQLLWASSETRTTQCAITRSDGGRSGVSGGLQEKNRDGLNEIEPVEETYSRERYSRRVVTKRYADYVRLHVRPQKIVFLERERELLKAGLTEFGLSLKEAGTLLHETTRADGISLESEVEKHLHTFLAEPKTAREARRAAKGKGKATISRARFEQAVDFYQALTRGALPRDETRKRVKVVVQRMGMTPEREWMRFGSRKWFDRIDPPD